MTDAETHAAYLTAGYQAGEHELHLYCCVCDAPVLLCCYVDGIDTNNYRCLGCRIVRPETPAQLAKVIEESRARWEAA